MAQAARLRLQQEAQEVAQSAHLHTVRPAPAGHKRHLLLHHFDRVHVTPPVEKGASVSQPPREYDMCVYRNCTRTKTLVHAKTKGGQQRHVVFADPPQEIAFAVRHRPRADSKPARASSRRWPQPCGNLPRYRLPCCMWPDAYARFMDYSGSERPPAQLRLRTDLRERPIAYPE